MPPAPSRRMISNRSVPWNSAGSSAVVIAATVLTRLLAAWLAPWLAAWLAHLLPPRLASRLPGADQQVVEQPGLVHAVRGEVHHRAERGAEPPARRDQLAPPRRLALRLVVAGERPRADLLDRHALEPRARERRAVAVERHQVRARDVPQTGRGAHPRVLASAARQPAHHDVGQGDPPARDEHPERLAQVGLAGVEVVRGLDADRVAEPRVG